MAFAGVGSPSVGRRDEGFTRFWVWGCSVEGF